MGKRSSRKRLRRSVRAANGTRHNEPSGTTMRPAAPRIRAQRRSLTPRWQALWPGLRTGLRRSSSVNRRQPSTAALLAATIVVVASLIALVLLPLLVQRQTESYRDENERHADPARAALN